MKNLIRLNFILLLAITVIFVSCEMKKDSPKHKNVEQTIIEKERVALDFWANGDPAAFAINFADDITYFDDIAASNLVIGIENVKKYLANLEGQIPPHTYELVTPRVQVYGDVAVLTLQYHATFNDTIKGQPWKATSVYYYSNGDWKVVHAHWSLVKEQPQ